MVGLGTHSILERVEIGNSQPKAARASALPDTMDTPQMPPQKAQGLRRRDLLTASLAAGAALSAWPLAGPSRLWGAAAGSPKRGGILRVRGYDPAHFDPHLTPSFKTHCTLSFVYSRLVRHRIDPEVAPGT